MNRFVDRLGLRSPLLRQELFGSPTLLVHAGSLVPENLHRERVTEEEIMQALREHGVDDLSRVKSAVLEIDGSDQRHLRGCAEQPDKAASRGAKARQVGRRGSKRGGPMVEWPGCRTRKEVYSMTAVISTLQRQTGALPQTYPIVGHASQC